MTTIKRAQSLLHVKKMQNDLRRAKRALALADSIMDYCQGDKWERKCTEKDRKKFSKIFEQLMKRGNESAGN